MTDVLLQNRRDRHVAKRLMRKLLRKHVHLSPVVSRQVEGTEPPFANLFDYGMTEWIDRVTAGGPARYGMLESYLNCNAGFYIVQADDKVESRFVVLT
ncbi:hypothetical protein AWB69_05787 [Caballeronia udeis]|uniref:Uncharacterized protein n=1 Tax=Caballeronia udeis TaxID=1232866 RepID=A0A158ID80_9BURK|nr:hypothetical protein AWB69_05787 [Caballeronia udeis]